MYFFFYFVIIDKRLNKFLWKVVCTKEFMHGGVYTTVEMRAVMTCLMLSKSFTQAF